MKTVLVVGAMEEEILPLLECGDFSKHESFPYFYYVGIVGDYRLLITVSKIGKVAMSSCVQHFITLTNNTNLFKEREIELVINIGVAGALSSELNQGDIVLADRLCQHDMDLIALGEAPGRNPDYPEVYFYPSKEYIAEFEESYNNLETSYNLKIGTIVSGDQFIGSKEQRNKIKDNFNDALACEMEGAALGQVCFDNNLPCIVLRAISDLADGEAPLSYNDFKEQAIVNLTNLVKEFLSK